MSREIVTAKDYLAAEDLPFDISYSGGKVSVGGTVITPVEIVDGVAKVYKDDIDKAIDSYRKNSGIRSGSEIAKEYEQSYGKSQKEILDKAKNRKEFSYNPKEDVSFASYKQQYEREGDRAMQDTLAKLSSQTGGLVNSAAVSGAAQQRQYWGDKLMDIVPELEKAAFARYESENKLNLDIAKAFGDAGQQWFDNAYQANRDTVSDIQWNVSAKEKRDAQSRENNMKEKEHRLETEKFKAGVEESGEKSKLDREKFEMEKEQNDIKNEKLINEIADLKKGNPNFLEDSVEWMKKNFTTKFGFDRIGAREFLRWQKEFGNITEKEHNAIARILGV